jgi:hypothetical protein
MKEKTDMELEEHIKRCQDCQNAIRNGYGIWSFKLCLALERLVKKGLVMVNEKRG